jgi:hypothetical protein
MMIAALLFGLLSIYLLLGWVAIAALDRNIAERRTGGRLWFGLLFWPITVILDLLTRRSAHH